MDISIIIVNYNTAEFVKRCIKTVLKQLDVEFEIITIDNASRDNSSAVLNQFGGNIKVINNLNNFGFGKANNQGFKVSTGKFIFLLNPDAELQTCHDLRDIVLFMSNNPQYGLVGTRIVNSAGKDETKPKYFYLGEKYIGHPFQHLPGKIAWVIGASMILPRNVYEKIGGFDEKFFLYGEDADLCLRVRKLGYEIGYLEQVKIFHVDGASERKTSPYDLTLKQQEALHIFYKKHYSKMDIQFLVKRNIKLSRYRMFLHKLRLILGISPSRSRYDHYRAMYDSSKNFFSTI